MLYSVPSAIVLRRWASREVEPKRRLLLRNAGPTALHFRLVLPQSDAFSLSGALLAAASAGGSSVGALAAGGTATLSVELARDRAPRQLVDELQVSTREGVLHIPLIALADTDTISGTISGGGEFVERWSGPEGDEVWDLAQVGPTSEPVADAGAGARSSRNSVPVRRDIGEGSIRRDFGQESTRRDLGEGSIRRGSTEGSIRRDSAEGSVPRDSAEGSVPRDAAEGSVWGVATCSARQWPPESLTPAECTGEAELAHYIDLMQQQWTQLQQGRRRKEGEDEQQQASIHLPRAPYACIPPVAHPYPTTCIHPLRVPHSPPYPSPPPLPPPSHSLHTPSPPPPHPASISTIISRSKMSRSKMSSSHDMHPIRAFRRRKRTLPPPPLPRRRLALSRRRRAMAPGRRGWQLMCGRPCARAPTLSSAVSCAIRGGENWAQK